MALTENKLKKHTRKGKLGTEIYITNPEEGGYTAFFKDFSEIVVQGETIKEAQKKLWGAVYTTLNFLRKIMNEK